jgi:hypothetical protein
MSYASERKLIETLFKNEWVLSGGAARTPVVYDQQVKDMTSTKVTWVRLSILSGEASQGSVGAPGNNLKRHAGTVAIQINTPAGKGSAEARDLADAVEAIFNNTLVENIRFTSTYSGGSPELLGAWSSWTIWCPFTRDEFNA